MFGEKKPSQFVTWLSLGAVLVIVAAVPLGYFYLSYQYVAGHIDGEIRINARSITDIINTNPELWELEQIRLMAALEHEQRKEYPETRRILNSKKEVVAESVSELDSPVLERKFDLMDSGAVVGSIVVASSLRPIVVKTLLLAAVSVSTGIAVFALILIQTAERKRQEQVLAKSQIRYKHLFQDSPVSLWEEDISELQAHIAALRSAGITDFDAYFTNHPGEVFKCVGLVKVISVNKTTLDLYDAPEQAALLRDLSQVFTAHSFDAFRGILIALAGGARNYECETVNQTLTGRTIDVLLKWSLISEEPTNQTVALISIVDITERKKAENALRVREKQFAESQRIAHIGSWEHNLKTGQVFWSDELFRLLGLDPGTNPADFRMFFEMVHPDDQPMLKKSIDETLKDNKPFSVEYRFILRDGTVRIIHAQAELLRDNAGDLVILSGTGQDITERKRQEQVMAESEASYRNLFDSSTDGIFILDLDGNFIDANRTSYERLGYTRDEFLALNISRLVHPSFAARVPERNDQLRENSIAFFESAHLRKDGSAMPVEVNARLLEYRGKKVFFSVIRDITERKKAEAELRESELRFRAAFENAAVGASIVDLKGRFIRVNRFLCNMLGYSEAELLEKTFSDVTHPDDVQIGLDYMRWMVAGEIEFASFEKRYFRKDGSIVYLIISPAIIRDGRGAPQYFMGLFQDISERKHAEMSLRESEERFRSIFENAMDGIMMADLEDKRQLEANRAICQMLGYTRDEILTRRVEDLHPKEDLSRVADLFEQQVRGEISLAPDVPMLRKNGTVIYVDINAARATLSGKQCLIGIFRDITERKKAEEAIRESEERLSEAQKMAHIGNWEENFVDNKLYWSDEVYRIYGVEAGQYIPSFESVGKAMHPDDLEPFLKAVNEALHGHKPFEMDYRLIRPDASVRTVHTIGEVVYDSKGSLVMLRGTVQDITDRMQSEERLRSAIREKETLLRELYHRTKNNMQVIMSLINLQIASAKAKGNEESQLLKETQNRILSMSLVHEKLYDSKDLSNVNLKNYVEDLTDALLKSYRLDSINVSKEVEVDDIMLSIDTIVPVGLIINELISNSLKYAFRGKDCGRIRIRGRRSDGGELKMHYSDDGIGFPPGFDLSGTSSLGLKLVHNLVSGQLMGKIRMAAHGRPEFSITFKEPARKKRI